MGYIHCLRSASAAYVVHHMAYRSSSLVLIILPVQTYQKDAIYRQMLEYKREKATLEGQLKDIQRQCTNHDDHLRIVDVWFSQVGTITVTIRAP